MLATRHDSHGTDPVTWLLIGLTVGVGITASLQVAMLGAIARERGGFEATWVSMLASLAGMAGVLLATALAGREPLLAKPFDRAGIYGFFVALMLVALVLASRGLPPYLALTGFLPVPYLLAASFIGPRIGLGVFLGAIIAGQLIGGIFLDHIGAFGATPRRLDAVRLFGAIVLVLGVILIRSRW
jgi:bacterial/archaeal transporter family-2 protein